MTLEQLYNALEGLYPRSLSCNWDHDGVMIAENMQKQVKKVLFALDVTELVAEYAIHSGFDLIITHHPYFFKPIPGLQAEIPQIGRGLRLYQAGIAVFSFHTRADCAEQGVNDALCALLNLTNISSFEVDGLPMGRIGDLEREFTAEALAEVIKERLGCPALRVCCPFKTIRRLAVLGGSGGSDISSAKAAGADGYLTGECGHHYMLDAVDMGLSVFVAGHDYTERPVLSYFEKAVLGIAPELQTEVFDKIEAITL